MATKTFKIGLSNTDKQNMAQDVYERLLALTFPEYDTTTEYEVGDFVVYNDQLYKCIGATTGAWDSTKWQLATLNDLVSDIEDAVAFVNDKANVDGNYPTMTVGVADQLSPYDDESGDDQDEPFILQGTGTANGTQNDFSTGSIALMKEKQGNTVVVNQIVHAITVSSTNNGITIASNNDYVFTVTVNNDTSYHQIDLLNTREWLAGHKYLIIGSKKVASSTDIEIYISGYGTNVSEYYIASITSTTNAKAFFYVGQSTPNGTYTVRPYIIDLTQWFNGDIPSDIIANPSNFFRYYQGSLAYNTGELVNANGRYIKCIGMNQWDEEWEVGGIDGSTGQNDNSVTTLIRSKNYISVVPNKTYYANLNSYNARLFYYDANKNFISYYDRTNNGTFEIPTNASYLRFRLNTTYGTTYKHDISINLYYEKSPGVPEPRCLTYEPHEVLTNNDTGSEVLRSAGSAKDIKKPDGTITRRVGSVDLGSLSWNYNGENHLFNASLTNSKTTTNLLTPLFTPYELAGSVSDPDKSVFVYQNTLYITDSDYTSSSDFVTAMSGVYLFYELAEPTEEQGTPFSENLFIDDFGSMEFAGTNGVPQGNLIFYPVDYKAFIDTLYNYTEGTPSNIALKSDLPTAPQTWAESLQGYDATKIQTLKNVEGTLTWVDDE